MPGLSSQFGFIKQSDYDTAGTPNVFLPFVSASISRDEKQSTSKGIIAGGIHSRTIQNNGGNIEVGVDLGLELMNAGQSVLWEACLGALDAGPPIVCSPALTLPSLTLQFGVGRAYSATVDPYTIVGAKVASWELAWTAGEIVTFGLTFIGKSRTTGTALATASYSTTAVPLKAINTTVSLGGVTYGTKSGKIRGDNKLSRHYLSGDTATKEPLHDAAEEREITAELVIEYNDLVEVAASDARDDDALSVTMASANTSVIAAGNFRRRGNVDPSINGRGIVPQTIAGRMLATSSTMSTAFSVTIDETA